MNINTMTEMVISASIPQTLTGGRKTSTFQRGRIDSQGPRRKARPQTRRARGAAWSISGRGTPQDFTGVSAPNRVKKFPRRLLAQHPASGRRESVGSGISAAGASLEGTDRIALLGCKKD